MLVRFSCERCKIPGVWTDCPENLLDTLCQGRRGCRAVVVEEGATARKPRAVVLRALQRLHVEEEATPGPANVLAAR